MESGSEKLLWLREVNGVFVLETEKMIYSPNLDKVKELAAAGQYDLVPVSCEILADVCTPIEALRILKNISSHCFLLESAVPNEKWGRFTFLGFDPKMEIVCSGNQIRIGGVTFQTENPEREIRQLLASCRSPRLPNLPPFTGGLVGYFSYDYLKYSEPSLRKNSSMGKEVGEFETELESASPGDVSAVRASESVQDSRMVQDSAAEDLVSEIQEFSEIGGVSEGLGFSPFQRSEGLEDLGFSEVPCASKKMNVSSTQESERVGGLAGEEAGFASQAEDSHFNEVDLMLFDKVIAFDHLSQKIILIANVSLKEPETEFNRAVFELQKLADLLCGGEKKSVSGGKLIGEMQALFSKDEFCRMTEKTRHYIHEGDIFQIVLSNRFSADFEGSLLNAYRVLRTMNPSPYMFYLSGTDVEIAGASPETLVKLEDGILHTFPLAGTRPRGKNEAEDRELEEELLADEKELAEHHMLVDLGRNDLGKISRFGTVEVEKLRQVVRFSKVMHIGSTVRGEIRDEFDALDAVRAVLPAGTLSGAPKIRACQLIEELEQSPRGIYGGGIGYLDFTGNLDLCIAIRIAYRKNGKVFVRSGAGIVADSVPENEYQECLNKAAAVLNALKNAEEVNA